MAEPFPNPETKWHAEHRKPKIVVTEVWQRIGQTNEEISCLSGGLANATFCVGGNRVLRIYQRDARALPRERELLSREWKSLRVPRLLDEGSDFLLLEYVPHQPLENSSQHGQAVGAVLGFNGLEFAGHQIEGLLPGGVPQLAVFPDQRGRQVGAHLSLQRRRSRCV